MRDEPANRTFFLYNTVCSITIYDGRAEVDEILDGAKEMAFQIRRMLDFYDVESELGRLNGRHETGVPYEVSEELCRFLAELLKFSVLSEGCFDPTVGPVVRLWNITARSPKKPSKEEVERARSRTGAEYVNCDTLRRTVTFERDEMVVDAGGAGKGYAVGRVAEYLKSRGVRSASVNFGGNLYLIGGKRLAGSSAAGVEAGTATGVETGAEARAADGTAAGVEVGTTTEVKAESADVVEAPWKIGIRAPWSREMKSIGTMELQDCGTATSGGYDRYFSEDEKIYHHLLDPRTGYPADNTLDSVTIVSDNALYTDLLSTACFVAGEDAVDRICRRVGGRVDYVLVKKDGTITVSDGLRTHFKRNDS